MSDGSVTISISAGPCVAERPVERVGELIGFGHPDSESPTQLGEGREVGVVQPGLPDIEVSRLAAPC